VTGEGREVLNFQILSPLKLQEFRFVNICQIQVVRVSQIVQGYIQHFFDAQFPIDSTFLIISICGLVLASVFNFKSEIALVFLVDFTPAPNYLN